MALLLIIVLNIHETNTVRQEEIFNCQPNHEACNIHNCTTFEALERSGFVCKEFPYFTGGWQWVDYNTYWNKEMETSSQCNISTPTQTSCTTWITSSITHSNMNQTCICNSNSSKKCDRWECHSTENIKNEIYFLPTAICQCVNYKQDSNINETDTCIQWHCTQLYDNQHPNDRSVNYTAEHSKIYNATHKCLSDKPDKSSTYYEQFQSINASFCWYWTADKINLDVSEWKISSCECLVPHIVSDMEAYCYKWSCNERSMDYYQISQRQFYIGCTVIAVAGGLILMCVFTKLQNPKNNDRSMANKCCRYICFIGLTIICLCGLLLLCFVVSGMCGIIVVCCVWILSVLVICPLVKWLWKKRQESYWDDDELSTDYKNKTTQVYDFWPKRGNGKNIYQYEAYDPI